jgi:ADP-ribose pyrophosphatase YjhB (NUDIX family)
MVKHRMGGEEWWCLPGGGVEAGESTSEAALRELEEECGVRGKILQQVCHSIDIKGLESVTFLIDIGEQEPHLGFDPEFILPDQILIAMSWMALSEISEWDRAFLWASGILNIPEFLKEVSSWGEAISYPIG